MSGATQKVLITGGAGYIGSTVASACLDHGIQPVILDDLSTGRAEFLRDLPHAIGDIADRELLASLVADHPEIDTIIHCAAKIVVPDSVADPLGYYNNNVAKSIALFAHATELGLNRFVFSSSASVYGDADTLEVDEDAPVRPGSPYATTKAMVEQVLSDHAATGKARAVSLRYFNPIGADPELRTGQQLPQPSHVVGKMMAATASGTPFTITGTDWPTRDGSGLRDYLHIWDLAQAHVAAVQRFDTITNETPHQVINLGTGRGVTVRELVEAYKTVVDPGLVVEEGPARPGDVAGACTVSRRASDLLNWTSQLDITDGLRDAQRWDEHSGTVLGDTAD